MNSHTKVDVYYNVTRETYSVKARGGAMRGRVVAHSPKVILRDVEFVVSQAGRARVLRDRVKNVHAYARGTLQGDAHARFEAEDPRAVEVSYNPYRAGSFVRVDNGLPVNRAVCVELVTGDSGNKIYAWGVE